jgi:hypothetical protein
MVGGGEPMAFRGKNRKAERGEVELLRGLIRLANQLQSSLALDAIVHVIATALSETFGFREASVYLREADGAFAVHATVGTPGRKSSCTSSLRSTWGRVATTSGTPATTSSSRSTTRTAG